MSTLSIIEFAAPGIEVLARELGYFADASLDLRVSRPGSSNDQRDRLLSGEADAGVTAIDNLIAWNAAGGDFRVVAQVERTTVADLIAQPRISSVADLRGERLAVDAIDNGFSIVLRKMLAGHGLGPGDYELVSVGGVSERCAALVSGEAAAGLLGPPWTQQALTAGLNRITTLAEALPSFPGMGVVVRAGCLAELQEPLSCYLEALKRAARWAATAEPADAKAAFVSAGLDEGLAELMLDVLPAQLEPWREGLELLVSMRTELGLLPAGAPTAAELLA
jgi:ABC-type nitrate/sulfonate/bicarbonate transport system substrate-binding protein